MKHNLTKGRMDDFFILRMGKTPPRDNSDYWLNGTNNWVAISDMGKSKYISATSECITDKGIADCNMVPVPTNTVIMSFKLSIGKTAITSKPIFTNEAIMSFLPKTEFADNILVDYIYYYLLGHRWGGTGKKAVMGVTLNKASLSATPFSFPSLADQKQAIAELNKINETIEDCREVLRSLDALAQSLFYDYFGDPVTNPKGFKCNKLGQQNELSSAKRVLVQDVVDSGIPFIRGTELALLSKQNSFDSSIFTMFITPGHYEKVKAITGVPKLNDLLIPSINPDGYVWEVNTTDPLYFKDGRVLWVHVNHDVYSSKWLKFALSKVIIEKFANLRGAVFAELTLVFLRNLDLIVPPIELQEKFAERIEQIEEQKKDVEETIANLQTLLDSRMDYWFN